LFKGQKDQFALGLQDTTLAYFDTADPAAKKVLRAEIERLVDSKVKQEVDQTIRLAAAEKRAQTRPGFSKANQEQLLRHVHEGTLWQSYRNIFTGGTVAFFEIEYFFPSVRNGFDIVIGNPPYLEARSPLLTAEQKDLIRTSMYERWPTTDNLPPRGSDLMVYFFERGLSLLQPEGVMLYITENSWLSTDYGKSLQEFLVKSTHVKYVLDSDYRYFSDQDGPAINTVVTFCDGRNPSPSARTLLLRAHESLDQVRAVALLQESTLETPPLTCVSFAPNDPRYSAWKWSTLAVGGPPFLDIVDVLSREAVAMSRITASAVHAGQGLNLTRELINQGPIGQEGQLREGARSLFTSLDGAPFVLSGTTAWILDARSLKSSASRTRGARDAVPVDIGDSRRPAALILPRGIGRYYCCLNRVLAYSDSNVEVYVDPGARSASANEVTDDLWLFLNSSLGWLLREVCGRANLGGGLLKAEATDLDSIPLYHRFAEHNRIGRLMSQLEKRQALSPLQEIGTPEHQEIDRLVFSELRFDSDTALTVMNLLTSLISGRQQRAASVRG
jgi:hypothetical protein